MAFKKYYFQHIVGDFIWNNNGVKTDIFHNEPAVITDTDLNTLSAGEVLDVIKKADSDTTYFDENRGDIEFGDVEILDMDGECFIEARVALSSNSDYAFRVGDGVVLYETDNEAAEEICIDFDTASVCRFLEFEDTFRVCDDGFECSVDGDVGFTELKKLMGFNGSVTELLRNIEVPIQNEYPFKEVEGKETYPNNENDYNVSFDVHLTIPKIILTNKLLFQKKKV